mmetsp:Transcript_29812/g.95347  ORF Transcript_29812/g.95347 Transcript_29812/m.95347 type:complete len:138 (-) Transcript_29812:173-586(-)
MTHVPRLLSTTGRTSKRCWSSMHAQVGAQQSIEQRERELCLYKISPSRILMVFGVSGTGSNDDDVLGMKIYDNSLQDESQYQTSRIQRPQCIFISIILLVKEYSNYNMSLHQNPTTSYPLYKISLVFATPLHQYLQK